MVKKVIAKTQSFRDRWIIQNPFQKASVWVVSIALGLEALSRMTDIVDWLPTEWRSVAFLVFAGARLIVFVKTNPPKQ